MEKSIDIEKQLQRIADVLEYIAKEEYGYEV